MKEIKNKTEQENVNQEQIIAEDNARKKAVSRFFYILIALIADIALCAIAYWLSETVMFWDPFFDTIWLTFQNFSVLYLTASVVITIICLACFDCYSAMWKYAGRHELLRMVAAFIVAIIAITIFKYIVLLPIGIFDTEVAKYWEIHIFVYALFSFAFCVMWRFFFVISSTAKQMFLNKNSKQINRVLVIGAGVTGHMIITKFMSHPENGNIPVAILDDNPDKKGQKICGVKVVGPICEINGAVKRFAPNMILIAINNLTKSRFKQIYEECAKTKIPVKMIPDIEDAEVDIKNTLTMQDIQIEHLLGREEFKVNQSLMDVAVKDKVVCVTGGAGSIGSELCRQALNFNCKHLIIIDYHENGMFFLNQEFARKYDTSRYTLIIATVREKEKIQEVFNQYKPEIVFHAAAYKHVPMMEIAPTEAIKTNLFGTKNVIEAAESAGVEKFVLISTDKAVNPSSVMGASKRITEMLIQTRGKSYNMKMAAVRFGNVLGSNGSVVPIFLQQIKEGGPITLTDREIKRYFMSIPEAVKLVLQTGAFASSGEIFVLDMGEPVYIYDLACSLIKLNGLEPEVDIKIKITGLRPGEKLFEELRYDKELVDETAHEGVFVNKMQDIDEKEFNQVLADFEALCDAEDEQGTVDKIFTVVPSDYRN